MRISQLEMALSAADLHSLLRGLRPGHAAAEVEHVAIVGPELRVRVRAEVLPVPVELVGTIAGVEPRRLVLNMDIANLGFLPGALRTAALEYVGARVAAPGITFQGGQLSIGTGVLGRALRVDFTLAAATLAGGQLRLSLRDVAVDPPGAAAAPTPPVAPESGAAEHSGFDHGPGEPDPVQPGEWPAGLPPERPLAGEHQATYRAIRERIAGFLDRSLPRWLQPAGPWLLMLPDFLVLLARLAGDPRVTGRAKLVAGGALAYAALPMDILPDFLPGLGLLDDVAVALLALEALVAMSPEAVVREHWPGDQDVLQTIRSGLDWAGGYFPKGMVRRMRDWVRQSGTRPAAGPAGAGGPEKGGPPPQPPVH